MSDIDDAGAARPSLVGACVLGALVTGAVLLLPILALVRAAQVVREARASSFDRSWL